MIPTLINQRWSLLLPEHRAARAEWWDGWEKERISDMHDRLRPGNLIFDIGSEEADMPALWASWGCRVVLTEPNPRVWPNAKVIFEANGLTPAGFFVGFAGPKDEMPPEAERWQLTRDGWPKCAFGPVISDHGFACLNERPDYAKVRIDTLAERYGPPDALTLDVEGSELQVMRGAERVLAEDRPLVWISVHPDFMPQYGDTADQLHAYMRAAGYLGELLAIDHEEHHRYTPSERV